MRLQDLRISLDCKHHRLAGRAIGGIRHDRDHLPLVGHFDPHAEGAVGAELHRLPLQRDVRSRLRRPVDDHFGIDVELEFLLRHTLIPVACSPRCGRAHRPVQPLLEQLLELGAVVFRGKPAAHGVDPVTVAGDVAPVTVEGIPLAPTRQRNGVASGERVKSARRRTVADVDAARQGRRSHVDEPVFDAAMHFDFPHDPLRRRGLGSALDLQQPEHRLRAVPFLAERGLGTLDAAWSDLPERMEPMGTADHHHQPVAKGFRRLASLGLGGETLDPGKPIASLLEPSHDIRISGSDGGRVLRNIRACGGLHDGGFRDRHTARLSRSPRPCRGRPLLGGRGDPLLRTAHGRLHGRGPCGPQGCRRGASTSLRLPHERTDELILAH